MKRGALLRGSGALALFLLATPGRSEPQAAALDWDAVERRIEVLRRKEHSLERVLERDGSEMDRVRRRLVARGRLYYRLTRKMPEGDFWDHAVRVERLRQGILSDMGRMRSLGEEKKGADRALSLLRERRVPLEVEKEAAGRAREALLSQDERERAFRQAFASSSAGVGHTAVYGALGSPDAAADSFERMRGRLSFPLPGRAEIDVVQLPGSRGPGLRFRTGAQTPVRSVYAGRVAFAAEYAEYGRAVILDHGEGYFSVMAGLAVIEVHVGDELPAGTRVGVVGSRGAVGEIYFELRKNDATLEPREWFGI